MIGFLRFIPSNDNDVHDRTELSADSWTDWQVHDAWEVYADMRDAYRKLFREVKQSCACLAAMDPNYWPAELEVAQILLRLSCIESIYERLAVLTAEARRVKGIIAQRSALLA